MKENYITVIVRDNDGNIFDSCFCGIPQFIPELMHNIHDEFTTNEIAWPDDVKNCIHDNYREYLIVPLQAIKDVARWYKRIEEIYHAIINTMDDNESSEYGNVTVYIALEY